MSVVFRTRKHGKTIDATFSIYSGESIAIENFLVGDSISVMFCVSPEQKESIKQMALPVYGDMVHIPCTVIKRSHAVVWTEVGRLDLISTNNIELQADSGYWEDILKWVIFNDPPEWHNHENRK